jgi:LysR substrate binding domain
MLETIFATLNLRPEIAVECDGATSLLAAVESGRGVAIVPEVFGSLAGSRVKLRPIEPTPAPMIVGCAYTISSASTVAAQRFLSITRSGGESGRLGDCSEKPFAKPRNFLRRAVGRRERRQAKPQGTREHRGNREE